jgi:hypothetical protein
LASLNGLAFLCNGILLDMNNLSYELTIKDKSKTAVIFLTYVRLEYMPQTAECFKNQTNKDFDLYISNNSPMQEKCIGKIKKYLPEIGTNIYVRNDDNRFKIFSRFIMANELALEGYEKIIFIDDDEIFPNTFIQECYDQYEDDCVKTFWAHKIEKKYKRKIKLENNEIGNYAGGGGLVCSSKVFLSEELMSCPEQYLIVDDLWLSYYLLKFTDYKIKTLKTNIRFLKDRKATFLHLGNLKQQFSDEFILPYSKHLSGLV